MTAFANDPETMAAQTAAVRMLNLAHINLDLRSKAERYRPGFEAFLKRHHDSLRLNGADDFGAAYFERAWPDNLQGTCIIANASLGAFPQWLIRPVVDGPLAASYAAGPWAPAFRVYPARGQLVVCAFEVAPHVSQRPFEAQVSAVFHTGSPSPAMSPADMATLASLPPHRQKAEQRLELWRRCLDWREQLARIGQAALPYEGFDVGDGGVAVFRITGKHSMRTIVQRLGNTSILSAPPSTSESPEEWAPRPGQRPHFTHVGDVLRVEPAGQGRAPHRSHAYERHRWPPSNEPVPIILCVALAQAIREGEEELPEQGFLLLSIGGDLKPIANARRAIDRFRNGQGFQPYMAGWLFDIGNAAQPLVVPEVSADGPSLNNLDPDQWAAVVKALAAPEICLIQGPPGTGKTTVIAEICFQEVRRGHCVMVSAQTNIAVENGLERLAHRPEVRPLRIAKAERVGEESRQFLDGHALGTWLQAVRGACQAQLRQRREIREHITITQEAFSNMRKVLSRADELRDQLATLETRTSDLQAERDSQRQALGMIQNEAEVLSRRCRAVEELSAWLEDPATEPPSVEAIASDRVGLCLSEMVRQLHLSLQAAHWPLTWLPPSPPSQPPVSIGILQLACRAARAAEQLESPVFEASSLCRGQGQGVSDEARRLRELEVEKARLTDSENGDDLVRLAELNRQLRGIRQDRWGTACRSILKPLADIFHGPLPPDLDEMTSSLQPEARWIGSLDALRDFAILIRDAVRQLFARHSETLRQLLAEESTSLQSEIQARHDKARELQQRIDQLEAGLDELREGAEQARLSAEECQARWLELWPQTRWDHEEVPAIPAMGRDVLRAREETFSAWQQDHAIEHDRQRRFEPILEEWVHRLGDKSGYDRPALHAQYARHANVVGITCYEAGQRDFYDHPDFEPFDVVIIDEVSKATPPELLAPMLLGRKVILVGDHRQLPPMFKERESSYQEAVEEGLIQAEDFERYRNLVTAGLFQSLFESTPDALQHTLARNYRSHPQIIEVVNQFYDGRLVYGFGEAA